MKRTHGLDEREMELVKLLMADCQTNLLVWATGDIQAKLKKLFAGTIEQMLEAEMDEHLGYEKNSIAGNNSGNSRKQDVSVTPWHLPHWGRPPQTPGVYPLEDTGEVEKQRIDSAALHRISCSRVGALSSVAMFRCIFSFGTFFGIIRVYTVVFSDP